MGSKNKNNELNNNTKDNPYDNYHGYNSVGQNLEDSNATNKDSRNANSKKNKNKDK